MARIEARKTAPVKASDDERDLIKFDGLDYTGTSIIGSLRYSVCAAFDRAYITLMVADHNTDVAEFQRGSKTAKGPDLKAWAGKTLPTLHEHQKLAKTDLVPAL